MSEAKNVWVVGEIRQGELHVVTGELLGKGRELSDIIGEELVAVLLGNHLEDAVKQCFAWGADHVIAVPHEELENYRTMPHTKVMEGLIKERNPRILLTGATRDGRDLAGRLAVRVETGLTADAIELEITAEKKSLDAWVPGFGGSIAAVITCPRSFPQMSTVRPGIFECPESDASKVGEAEVIHVSLPQSLLKTKILNQDKVEKDPLPNADRVVGVGAGIGGDMALSEKLGLRLDAVLGATRPICDLGMLPRARQIGSTGVSIRPELLLNMGISGAAHYTSGIREAKRIIAINTNEDAPIFSHVDLGIVGDIEKVIPALLEEIGEEVGN